MRGAGYKSFDIMSQEYEIKVVYGTLNPNGSWSHNPLLSMSKDEQYAECKEAIEAHRKAYEAGMLLIGGLTTIFCF